MLAGNNGLLVAAFRPDGEGDGQRKHLTQKATRCNINRVIKASCTSEFFFRITGSRPRAFSGLLLHHHTISRRFSVTGILKRSAAALAAVTAVVMFSGCGEPTLIYNQQIPDFKAPDGKALCVVMRPMAITGNDEVKIYSDTTYVGATTGNTVLSFAVEPGEHIIIGDGTNKSKVKFNFQAGKVYYINHTVVTLRPSMGYVTITIITSTFKPLTGPEAVSKLESEKGKISWVQPNPANMQENLKAKDLEDVKKDYDKWAGDPKNAEDFKIESEYPGY